MYSDYNEEKEESYYADDDNKFDKEKLKKIAFFVIIFVVLIILILLIAKGCSKKSNNDNGMSIDTKIPTVVVGKNSISLSVGGSEQLFSDVLNVNDTNPIIDWYSEDSTVASVNDDGYIIAEGVGQTNIVALYRNNGNVYQDKCLVTVSPNAIAPDSISLGQEEMSVKLGEKVLLQVSITPVEAQISDLVFESEAPEIVSVDENGYITAESLGTTAIIVKSKDETVASSIIVIVTETGTTEINPTGLKLIGLSNGLLVGNTAQIIYDLSPNNATNNMITWTSSDPSVATVNNDIITANKAGSCTIIGTTENGISDKLDIVVESNNVPVESIALDGELSISMNVGGTKMLNYNILPTNATNKNVTYTTSNSNVVFVDSNGVIYAMNTGISLVTITTEDGKKTANIMVTVTNADSSIDTSSSDSSSGSSSGGSSSGESSSGSSSSNEGSSSTNSGDSTSSCDVNSFTIKSNQSTAVTSNLRFENTKPFTNSNPGFTITKYDSCLKKVSYSLWYNADLSKLNTSLSPKETGTITRTQGTFYFSKGNNNKSGYYYIKLTVQTNDNNTYYKYYYAQVGESSTTTNYITVTPTSVKNGGSFTITKDNSDVTKVYYCITASTGNCVVNSNTGGVYRSFINFSNIKIGGTFSKKMYYRASGTPTINYGRKICFQAYTNKYVGTAICRTITQ